MRKTWHIYLIGVLALLSNAMGALDYVMTQTKNAAYLAQFTPEQLSYFDSFPAWVQASWAIAVWFGVLGSMLLLLRMVFTVPVFAISFVAMVVTTFHNTLLAEVKPWDIMDDFALYFTLAIFAVALFLWMYARALQRSGLLR